MTGNEKKEREKREKKGSKEVTTNTQARSVTLKKQHLRRMNDAWRNPLMTQGGARAPAAFSGGSSRSNSSPWSVGDGNNDDDDNEDFMKRDE